MCFRLRKRLERETQEGINLLYSAEKDIDKLLLELKLHDERLPHLIEENIRKADSKKKLTPEKFNSLKTELYNEYHKWIYEKIGELRENKGELKTLRELTEYKIFG
jgi:hypothetical protein